MDTIFKLKENTEHGNINFPLALYKFVANNNIVVTEHWHDETELLYVAKGTLGVNINNKIYTCKENELIFVNSGELHSISGNDVHYFAVVFNSDMLSFSVKDMVQNHIIRPITEGKITFFHKPRVSSDMLRLVKHIIHINTEKSTGYMLETKASLLMLINRLICADMYSTNSPSARQSETDLVLKSIVTYISEHFHEKILLGDISKEFNMSPKYFCRFFKKHFHKTFIEYLNLVRIENAVKIFDTTDSTVTETAFSCGFSNMSYFTKIFKEIMGYTPSQYRNL